MEETSGQLDEFWEAIVAGDQEKASEIREGFEQASDGNSASDIANLLLQLHQARKESDHFRSSLKVLEAGTIIGDYKILDVIGQGGMGVVYRAVQMSLNRIVALKSIRADIVSPRSIRRFCEEAATIARLKHPNIVTVYDIGEFEGTWFYSMDWIEGDSLGDRIKSNTLGPKEAARILSKVANAVAFAHENKILHRDIKPSNILIDSDGQVFISDFGLARTWDAEHAGESGRSRLTQSGSILGTPSYLSPEQAAGQSELESPATDVYGLGATIYESLCGRPPFLTRSLLETLRQICNAEPVQPNKLNPEISADLNTICMKCLEKEPEQRYPNASELRDDLNRFLNHQAIAARPVGLLTKLSRWCRREPRLAASLLGILGLIGILFFISIIYSLNLNQAFKKTKLAEFEAVKASETARSQRDQTLETLNRLVYRIHTELQKDPGNLEARRHLLQAAVDGFEKIVSQHTSDSEETPERASVIARIKLADVLVLLGEEDRARKIYREAIQAAKKIIAVDSGNEHQLDLATAWYRLGLMEITLENPAIATTSLKNSQDILLHINPNASQAIQLLYFDVLFSLGWAKEQSFQLATAIEVYMELSDRLKEEFTESEIPVDIRRLRCNVYARLTHCYTEQFQLDEADTYFGHFQRDYQRLDWEETTGPSDSIYNPAWALRDVSKYLLRSQQKEDAINYSKQSLQNAEKLLALHRDNVQVSVDVGIARFHHAMVLRSLGEMELADQELERAIETVESGPRGGHSDRAKMMLPLPYVFRMEFSQRQFEYDSALKHCQQATRIMESLEREGKLNGEGMKSALAQTRRLERAFRLIPQAIKDVDSIQEHPESLAALLYVFCCDYFESHDDFEMLFECGRKLLELEVDDHYQFAIHMNSLARASCRATVGLPEESVVRSRLIQQAFESLRRSIVLNPGVFNAQLDTEPDLAVLRNEDGFNELVNFYQNKIANDQSDDKTKNMPH